MDLVQYGNRKCFICHKPIKHFFTTIKIKTNNITATDYDGVPFLVKGRAADVLGVPEGAMLHRHPECGPGCGLWTQLFGQSEISKLLGKVESPDTETHRVKKTPDRTFAQFIGRVKYMIYMDSRPAKCDTWLVQYRSYVVAKEKEVITLTIRDHSTICTPSEALDTLNNHLYGGIEQHGKEIG